MILKLKPSRLVIGKGPARCSTCGVELDCPDIPGLSFSCGDAWNGSRFYCSAGRS